MSITAAPSVLDALAALPPLHEEPPLDDLRRLYPATTWAATATRLDGALNLLLDRDALTAAVREMAAAVEPGGFVVFDVDTASRHAWRLGETWVVEDATTYICWEGKGADEADARIGWCDVYAFVDEGPAWRRTDHRLARRLWADEEVRAAATCADLQVVARYGQAARGALDATCDDTRHHQAVYVLRRPVA